MDMSEEERKTLKIQELPRTLGEAVEEMAKDAFWRQVLGTHIFEKYTEAKRAEWRDYCRQVTDWELDHYLYKI